MADNPTPIRPGALDASAASRYLSVSVRTIQRMTATGELRAVRYGRLVRYRPADLDEWLERYLDAA